MRLGQHISEIVVVLDYTDDVVAEFRLQLPIQLDAAFRWLGASMHFCIATKSTHCRA
jgi:hypothetical protein